MDLSGFRGGNESNDQIQYNDTVVALDSLAIDARQNGEDYSDLESDEESEMTVSKNVVRPKFNEWKGQEMGLYLLGPFDSEFDRNIKSMVRPEMVDLKLDPFYRNDYADCGEPVHGSVYRIWKNSRIGGTESIVGKKQSSIKEEIVEHFPSNEENENPVDSEEDDGNNQFIVGYEPLDFEASESETENEISEFIDSLKVKKRKGENVTGESLWYDESKDVIRNLHAKSYSLTSYALPDNNLFGKGAIFRSLLTTDELKMLQPLETRDVNDDLKDIGNS